MSDQGLRDALEKLAERWARMDCRVDLPENAQWGEGVAQGYSNSAADLLRELAAHPAESVCLGDGVCTNPWCPRHGVEPVGVSDEPVDTRAYLREKYREELDEWWAEQVAEHNASVGVSDEAVELLHAQVVTEFRRHGQYTLGLARAALEAAQPFMQPQVVASLPTLDREAVLLILAQFDVGGWKYTDMKEQYQEGLTAALLRAVRPLPTREQMWQAVVDVRDAHPRVPDDADSWEIVDAVLALMGGAETEARG